MLLQLRHLSVKVSDLCSEDLRGSGIVQKGTELFEDVLPPSARIYMFVQKVSPLLASTPLLTADSVDCLSTARAPLHMYSVSGVRVRFHT